MNDLISQNSIDTAYEHHCPICKNLVPRKHIIIPELGVDKYVQPNCECEVAAMHKELDALVKAGQKREVEKKFALHSLGERFRESTFDNFIPRIGSENSYKMCKQYAEEFKQWDSDSIILWGTYGNGKSHLAGSVANFLNQQDYIVIYQNVPDLLEKIRATFSKNNQDSESDILKHLNTCDLLILDDIGAEKVTDWVQDVLFRIVDGRYRKKKPIMYTSNLKPSLLADKVGERIYDRMNETSLAVENKATSYRREKAIERFKKQY